MGKAHAELVPKFVALIFVVFVVSAVTCLHTAYQQTLNIVSPMERLIAISVSDKLSIGFANSLQPILITHPQPIGWGFVFVPIPSPAVPLQRPLQRSQDGPSRLGRSHPPYNVPSRPQDGPSTTPDVHIPQDGPQDGGYIIPCIDAPIRVSAPIAAYTPQCANCDAH